MLPHRVAGLCVSLEGYQDYSTRKVFAVWLRRLVEAINNIPNNLSTNYYWMWWIWNFTAREWEYGPVICDKYRLNDGDVIAWYYETAPWGPPEVAEIIPEMGRLAAYLVLATGVIIAFMMVRRRGHVDR